MTEMPQFPLFAMGTPNPYVIPAVYRDSFTYFEQMAGFIQQINYQQQILNALIASIPEVVADQVTAVLEAEYGPRLEAVEAQSSANTEAIAELTASTNTAIEGLQEQINGIINSNIEISDPVIFGVISDVLTQSHIYIQSMIDGS